MKCQIKIVIYILIITIISGENVLIAFGYDGYSGFSGGISSGAEKDVLDYEYKEICFLSGEPIVLTGNMNIKKTSNKGKVVTTYKYNLTNTDGSSILERKFVYNTEFVEKENGQIVEQTEVSDKSTEVVVSGDKTYEMDTIDIVKSGLIDNKPAIDFYVGNVWQRKTYTIYDANKNKIGNVSVDVSADNYGYNNFWGSTETYSYNFLINTEEVKNGITDKWGGTAKVTISNSIESDLIYMENEPEVISFSGGFINKKSKRNVLEYTTRFPEFDSDGISIDNIVEKTGETKIDSFPKTERLLAYSIPSIKGHWAEMDILKLFSIEVFKSQKENFWPEKYTNRSEFVYRLYNAIGEIPEDPTIKSKTTSTSSKVESPFNDVKENHPYINEIVGAYNKNIIAGTGNGNFGPDDNLKFVDAITIIIRTLGLDKMVTSGKIKTSFRDDSLIPEYALNSVYVAQKIGLIVGDNRGYLKPNEKLTNARSSALIVRLIDYMSNGISKDYKEGIIDY